MINADAIREAKFEKTAVFGYKTEDVDLFLDEIAKAFEKFEEEKADLEEKIVVLAEAIENYREQEEGLKTTLLAAQRLSDSLVKEAKVKAEEILENAKLEAEQLEKETSKKRDSAEREINREMDKERKNLLRIQKEVTSFKANLLDLYKHHLDIITALPEFEEEEEELEIIEEIVGTVVAEDVAVSEEIEEVPVEEVLEENLVADETLSMNPISEISTTAVEDEEDDEEELSLFGDIRFGDDFTVSNK